MLFAVTIVGVFFACVAVLYRADRTPRDIHGTCLNVDGSGVQDVVLMARNGASQAVPSRSANVHVALTQRGFTPAILLMRPGDRLLITNKLESGRNVRIECKRNQPLNRIVMPGEKVAFNPELSEQRPASLACAIHPVEAAFIFVSDSYLAKSDARGHWRMRAVFPGTYELKLWHRQNGFMHELDLGNRLFDVSKKNYRMAVPRFDNSMGVISLTHESGHP